METLARLTGFGASAPEPAPERVTYDDSDDADMSEVSDNEGEDVVQLVDDAAAEAGFARASDDEDEEDDEDEDDDDSYNDATEGSNASSSSASAALDAAVQERQVEMERAAAAAASGALEASREAAAAALAEVEKGAAEIAAAAAAVASAPPPPPPAQSSSPDRAAATFERARVTLGSSVELPARGGAGSVNASEADEKAPVAAAAAPAAAASASVASSLVASLMRRVTGAESADAAAPAAAATPSSSSSGAAAAPAADAAKAAAAAAAPATSAWASGSLPWLPRRAAAPAAPAPAAPAPAAEEEASSSSAAAAAPAAPARAPAPAAAAPAGGLTGLPPRAAAPAPAPSSSSSSSHQQEEQQAAPAPPRPAGGLSSLPPRPAGGVGALPPRGGSGGGGNGSAPSAGAAASTPAASNGAGASSAAASQSAASAPASGASAPAVNGTSGAAAGGAGGGAGAGGGGGPPPAAAAASASASSAEPTDEPAEAAALRARIRAMVVLLFRLCLRLRQPPAAPIARNTLSKLAMAERIRLGNAPAGRGLDPQAAAVEADALEARGDGAGALEALPLDCTVLVLGPAGAGKTSMIRGLLRESGPAAAAAEGGAEAAGGAAASSNPSPTRAVSITSGKVAGCTLHFIDTPGLLRGPEGIRHNLKVLKGVRAAQAKHRPTMVLYVDRMDTPPRGGGAADASMLKSVSDALGRAVWFNTILVLTHAASAPPDGANGAPLSHDVYSQNRMHLLQQGVRAAAGDGRLFNPAALVDCHPRCRVDPETGDALLPSGGAWRPSLVMWCLASKLLADAEDVLHVGAKKAGAGGGGGGAGGGAGGESMQERIAAMMRGARLPPIPHLLSKLNKGKNPVAKPDDDADVLPLRDIKKLRSSEQRSEELRRRKELVSRRREELHREGAGGACPLYSPEPPLTASFDEVPEHAYRYRDTDETGNWITRPFIEPTPLDHDDGIDGVQVERATMIRRRSALIDGVPCRVFAQFQKDKEKTTVHAEVEATLTNRLAEGILLDEAVAAAAKEKKRQKKLKRAREARRKKGVVGVVDDDDIASSTSSSLVPRAPLLGTVTTTVGFEGMTFQRDMLYTARAETKTNVPGLPSARAAVGLSASRLVEGGGVPTGQGPIAYGAKVDTRMAVLQGAVDAGVTLGAMTTATARGGRETATAGSSELTFASNSGGQYTVGGSFMNFRKDLGLQGNLGSQWEPTMRTVVAANATLNNKGAGGVTLRVTSNDRPQLGLVFLAPVLGTLWNAVASRRKGGGGAGDEDGGEEEEGY